MTKIQMRLLEVFDNACFYSGTRLVVYRCEANEILPDSITFLFYIIHISYAERQLCHSCIISLSSARNEKKPL